MQVQVRFFAAAREAAKVSTTHVELAEPATVASLLAALERSFPPLAPLLPKLRVAVDEEFAGPTQALTASSDVALIPPVAGG